MSGSYDSFDKILQVMNISYNWLKELIEIELSPQELAEKLTNAGLAVDSVEGFGDDYVLVFDLTSNRSDCLSHLGVAREIKALTGKELKLKNYNITNPETSLAKGETTYDSQAEANIHFSPCRLVTIEAPDLCHRLYSQNNQECQSRKIARMAHSQT
jgi:phenylalanyl-tRNA synthetase beta subunit